MKTLLILISIVVVATIFLLFVLGKYSQRGHAPGLVNGSLSKCTTKPNCVCSEYIDDVYHYIKPIEKLDSIKILDISKASATIQEMGGTIHSETDKYVAATFISPIFGFVDDFEIRNDQTQGILHIRSASRMGYSDGGVNRKRAEKFKKIYFQNVEKYNKAVIDNKAEA